MNVLVARPIKSMRRGCYRVHKPDCSTVERYSDVVPLPSLPDTIETYDCAACGGRYMPRLMTHCPKGHPYDAENLIIQVKRDGTISRKCRICKWDTMRAYRLRKYSDDEEFKRRRNERVARTTALHPERRKARTAVFCALRSGTLKRPDRCEWCGQECTPEASHDDYSRPLDVEWLCKLCHSAKDRKYMPVRGPGDLVASDKATTTAQNEED